MPRSPTCPTTSWPNSRRLIEVPDPDLYAALTGDKPLPPEYAGALFDRIKAFRAADHDA